MSDINPRRIGVLGGTFDPPHNGHVLAACQARDRLNLDLVVFTVANDPWQKTGVGGIRESGLTEVGIRLAMVEAAVETIEGLLADDLEMQRGGPTYTADTLYELHDRYPGADLFLLIGSDVASALDSWIRPEEVRKHATIVVMDRPGHDGGRPPDGWDYESVFGQAKQELAPISMQKTVSLNVPQGATPANLLIISGLFIFFTGVAILFLRHRTRLIA